MFYTLFQRRFWANLSDKAKTNRYLETKDMGAKNDTGIKKTVFESTYVKEKTARNYRMHNRRNTVNHEYVI